MARYIDADDEIRKWCVLNCGCEPCECGHTFEENGTEGCTLVDFINDQPTADVVEVVRCKDCVHTYTDTFLGNVVCSNHDCIPVKPDDYCSWGERRDDA